MPNSQSVTVAYTKSATFSGLQELLQTLAAIPNGIRTKVLAEAVSAAADPLVSSAKSFAKTSERTGALRKSIGKVVRQYPNRGVAIALVGPRHGYYRGGQKVGKGKFGGGKLDSPVKYGHLIEYGHHAVSPEKGKTVRKGTAQKVSWVPAKPFLHPALLATKGAVQAKLRQGIADGMEKVRLDCVKSGIIAQRSSDRFVTFQF